MTYELWAQWATGKVRKATGAGGSLTAGLIGKTAQKKFGVGEMELEAWLTRLRNDGAIAIANGRWYPR